MTKAKECANDIMEVCYDQYDEMTDEEKNMTEEEAKKFVIDHLAFTIGGDGEAYLFFVELNAIKGLDLYDRFDIPKEYVEARLRGYDLEVQNES